MRRAILVVICLATLIVAASSGLQAVTYETMDLGFRGSGLNDLGQVAGSSSDLGAVFWDPASGFTQIQALPGDAYTPYPNAINNAGRVVGLDGPSAFAWTADTGLTRLNGMAGATKTSAFAVNGLGQAVGYSLSYSMGATFWDTDNTLTIISQDFDSVARDINNAGQVVGTRTGGAFLWTKAGGLEGIGSFGPAAINNAGIVVGTYSSGGTASACTWQRGTGVTLLPTLPGWQSSRASDVNDLGQVMGFASATGDAYYVVLWNPDGSVIELAPVAGTIYSDGHINNRGQILSGSILWTPIPEPSSLLALACGLAGVVGIASRRRGR